MRIDFLPEHSMYLEEKRREMNIHILKFISVWVFILASCIFTLITILRWIF